jgi:tetratricopeptide (TPR) repeat protein
LTRWLQIPALLLSTTGLAAGADPPTAPASAPVAPPSALPPEGLVRLLREARIAGMRGQASREQEKLEQAMAEYPAEIGPVLGWLERPAAPGADPARRAAAWERLAVFVADPSRPVPLLLIERQVRDARTSAAERDRMIDALSRRSAGRPGDVRLLEALASFQLESGRKEEGRATLERLEAARPDRSQRLLLIRLDLALGNFEPALARIAVEQAAEPSPIFRAWKLRALAGAGRTDQVAQESASLLTEFSRPGEIPYEEAMLGLFALRDADQAEAARALAAKLAEAYPGDEFLGRLAAAPGSPEATTVQGSTFARINDGATRIAAGDHAGAYEVLAQVTREEPENEVGWYNLGLAAARLEKWDEAEAAMTKALDRRPDLVAALRERGQARIRLGRPADAVPDLERVLTLKPGDKSATELLAWARRLLAVPPR